MAKEFKINLLATWWRKWDVIKTQSNGKQLIVIGTKSDNGINTTQLTVYPYKRYKYKWMQWIWFKWLKLRIYLKIIKV